MNENCVKLRDEGGRWAMVGVDVCLFREAP